MRQFKTLEFTKAEHEYEDSKEKVMLIVLM